MPKLATFSDLPLRPSIVPARGLHDPDSERTYFFDEFDTEYISIGRGTGCDIRLTDRHVSNHHARVKLHRSGQAMLRNFGRNGTYVDGVYLDDQVPLTAGMHIHLGSVTVLVATDRAGAFPILVYSIPELCYYAVALYGNPTAASRFLGKERRFVDKRAKEFQRGHQSWWRRITRVRRRSNRIVLLTTNVEAS